VLEPGEDVELVTPASTRASPKTLLAVTDRRPATAVAIAGHVRERRFRPRLAG